MTIVRVESFTKDGDDWVRAIEETEREYEVANVRDVIIPALNNEVLKCDLSIAQFALRGECDDDCVAYKASVNAEIAFYQNILDMYDDL